MNSFKLSFVFAFVLMLSACATYEPHRVPIFEPGSLPVLRLQNLKHRTMQVEVENTRASNLTAKNADQVEKAVMDAVVDSLMRGGFKVGKSQNKISIKLMDCDSAPDGAACVKAEGVLQTKVGKLTYEALSHNGYQRENASYQQFGDVSKAYFHDLEMIFKGFEKRQNEL